MHDRIHLGGEFFVEAGDHLLDGVEDILLDQAGVGQSLLHKRANRVVNFGSRPLAARLEALLQQRGEFVGVLMNGFCRGGFLRLNFSGHVVLYRFIRGTELRNNYTITRWRPRDLVWRELLRAFPSMPA